MSGFFRMQGMLISVDWLPHLNHSLRSLFPSEIIYRFAFNFDHRGLVLCRSLWSLLRIREASLHKVRVSGCLEQAKIGRYPLPITCGTDISAVAGRASPEMGHEP